MKTEISRIKANDGDVQARVRIELRCNGKLMQDELHSVSKTITEKVADALRDVRFTDFGPSNTIVRL